MGIAMKPRRTWWNLEKTARKPSDYDIASTDLLYYPKRGFEVKTPMEEWYRKYQAGSPLRCGDWDRFRDPAEMTYSRYVESRRDKEIYVDGLLNAATETGHDQKLGGAYLQLLDRLFCPMRYPFHGLQMVSSYLGSMAPGGRIAICFLLQTADEVRRVHRIAYRMRQLQETRPGMGAESRYCWELEEIWQPLRRTLEKLLVTFDWGEAFTALNLALKPALDELFLLHFARTASLSGDEVMGKLFLSFHEDSRWRMEWTSALVRMLVEESPENARQLDFWCRHWQPLAEEAAMAFVPALAEAGLDADFIRDGVRGALGLSRALVREAVHAV
jgi:toluene monooxygenase system protein E